MLQTSTSMSITGGICAGNFADDDSGFSTGATLTGLTSHWFSLRKVHLMCIWPRAWCFNNASSWKISQEPGPCVRTPMVYHFMCSTAYGLLWAFLGAFLSPSELAAATWHNSSTWDQEHDHWSIYLCIYTIYIYLCIIGTQLQQYNIHVTVP